MSDPLTIGGWMLVDDRCCVRRGAARSGYLTFVFDGGGSEFELTLAPAVLRRMMELAER